MDIYFEQASGCLDGLGYPRREKSAEPKSVMSSGTILFVCIKGKSKGHPVEGVPYLTTPQCHHPIGIESFWYLAGKHPLRLRNTYFGAAGCINAQAKSSQRNKDTFLTGLVEFPCGLRLRVPGIEVLTISRPIAIPTCTI